MNWIKLLRSLQADFINRLKSDSAILHHLTNPRLSGYHSELTIVSGEELEQIRDKDDKLKNVSKQPLQNEFIDYLTGKLGEVVVKKYLDDSITPIDVEVKPGGDGKIDFRLTSEPSVSIQVKARHASIERVKWKISFEEVDKMPF